MAQWIFFHNFFFRWKTSNVPCLERKTDILQKAINILASKLTFSVVFMLLINFDAKISIAFCKISVLRSIHWSIYVFKRNKNLWMNFNMMRRNWLRKNSSLLSSIKSPFFVKGTLKKTWLETYAKEKSGRSDNGRKKECKGESSFLWYILKRKERGSEAKRSTFENLKRSSPEAMVW